MNSTSLYMDMCLCPFFLDIWILVLGCMVPYMLNRVTCFFYISGYLDLVARSRYVHVERVTYCYKSRLVGYVIILS
jgi:hypothetical protein